MAVCKRCGCAIPLGQKTCDICEPRIASAAAQAPIWQTPQPPVNPMVQPQIWQVAQPAPQPPVNPMAQPQTWQVAQPPMTPGVQPPIAPTFQPPTTPTAGMPTWNVVPQAPRPQPQAYAVPAGIMPASELASSAQAWAGRAGGMQFTAATAPKAGFWMRFLAWIIDGFCYGIPAYAVGHVILHGDTVTYYLVGIVIEVCYFMYFWSSYGKGQTIGMQLLHMKVVKTDGSLLTLSGAFVRFIGLVIAAIPFDIGLIWAAFDSQKQGWHDKIAGTYVISNW